MKAYNFYSTLLIATIAGGTSAGVTITGIIDGDLSGGNPKAIELYIDGTVDFSGFDLFKSSNGAAFGSAGDMSGLGMITDSFVYLVGNGASGLTSFQTVFGASGDFANTFSMGNANGNGNDGFQIVDASSTVLDQVWQVDGSNYYTDSYMYRVDGSGPEGAAWTPGNWTVGSVDGMNAEQTGLATPFGTYQVPSPGVISLLTIGGVLSTRRRRS